MNAREQIAKLEEILARVKTRAAEPRPLRSAFAVHAAPTASPPAESSRDDFATSPPPTLDTQAASAPPGDIYSGWSAPPPNFDGDDNSDVDVEVSSEVVEVDIDIDEPMPTESGSVPVAEYSPQAILDELDEHHARGTDVHGPPVLEDVAEADIPNDIPTAQPLANELEEPTPSSSPRPIAEPEYEEESSPRHTPPPESGKQVAAPSVAPAPRKPEMATPPPPAPSLEGHTLIGGWREPGLAREAPAPVHAASAAPPPRDAAPPPRLSAEVTRGAPLPTTARVATFEGAAPAFKPSSFGELLDATLEL